MSENGTFSILSSYNGPVYILSFFQLPQMNPGLNNQPFKFTKYSNAYMLVYIRYSDMDKVVCNVDEKDIAKHLRVPRISNYSVNLFSNILYMHHQVLVVTSISGL
jgi:hypothetical protein